MKKNILLLVLIIGAVGIYIQSNRLKKFKDPIKRSNNNENICLSLDEPNAEAIANKL